jgi:N-acyl-D-aspartate/D-glutamate deacylase
MVSCADWHAAVRLSIKTRGTALSYDTIIRNEVLEGPGLTESVRHGVTTVATGSCSISTIHVDAEEAGDLFGRVEAIPREHVIKSIAAHKSWSSSEDYIKVIEDRPLGPNLCSFIGHSDIRTVTMGLERSTDGDIKPTAAEMARMEQMLTEALDAGFIGLSTNQLRFDKLDGQVCRSRTLPSTYAKWRENRRLKKLVRTRGRVLQSAPDISMPLNMHGCLGKIRTGSFLRAGRRSPAVVVRRASPM